MSLPQVIEADFVGTLLVPTKKLHVLIFAVRERAWEKNTHLPPVIS